MVHVVVELSEASYTYLAYTYLAYTYRFGRLAAGDGPRGRRALGGFGRAGGGRPERGDAQHGARAALGRDLALARRRLPNGRAQLDDAIAKAGGTYNGTFALMRHTAVYEDETDRRAALDAIRRVLGKFGNLMTKTGEVRNGFPDEVPLDELDGNVRVDPVMLEENLAFGSPEKVIAKLKAYEALGVDAFIYYASMGLGMEQQKRSLQLFIDHVLPEFT